jgi:diguanylate cyclase (GGDEF)-like protein
MRLERLTGLPNRALLFEYGSYLIAAACRNHRRGALLFIDLDRFKPINDIYGHDIGDRVLQEVGRRLTGCTRQEDVVGRLGGDEFVVVLPHVDAGRHPAAVVAQHVIESISRPILVDSLELSISPSIGISYYPEHATDISALIHTADLAMYQAKQSGRANYQFYTPELDRQADAAYALEARLRDVLRHDGLELHYQPVVDIKSGKFGRALNLEIVEEGIESEDTMGYLRSEGCDQAQGFWVSHPLPAPEFALWYREQYDRG